MVLFVALGLFVAVVLLVLWMAGGRQEPRVWRPSPLQLPGFPEAWTSTTAPLTVVTWNLGWAYGWGSVGTGSSKSREHFERTLDKMGEVLAELKADIVLLQEVDFDSTRSHHIDQAERLADKAGLTYIAKAVTWQANWIPFPYWPPEDHFGSMLSGGAILSRFPIEDYRVETVEKPKDNPFWYNLFYLFRFHQQATLQSPFGEFQITNVHAENLHRETRIQHARRLANLLESNLLPESIVGGDFNTVPPEAKIRDSFPDDPEMNYVDDPTLGFIRGVPGLVDTIDPEAYLEKESDLLTYPSHEPNRKIDYLFHGAGLEVVETFVPRALAGDLSDHLPLVAKVRPLSPQE